MPERQKLPPGSKWILLDVIRALEESVGHITDISFYARLSEHDKEVQAKNEALDAVLNGIKTLTYMVNDNVNGAQEIINQYKEKRK